MEPKQKFEKIELNVLRVQGFPHDIRSLFSKVHLEMRVGKQLQRTTSARGMAPHVWDEKFAFDLTGPEDLSLGLYLTKPFGKAVLLSSVAVPLDLEPRNQDRTRTFPSSNKRRPMTVTYQLREPGTNLRLETTTDESARDPRCPVFAFIIGIDQYLSSDIPDLRGCVNDAQTVKTYLVDRFRIPEAQIALLANEDATRNNILGTFESHLIDNSSIEKDDTIIIYYAGHGSRANAPDSWSSTDGKLETLVPHDERTGSLDEEVIHGIPDCTLNVLLSKLASAKGNNITVILDCGHSAPGTGVGSSQSILPLPRFVQTLLPIPENLDRELFGTGEIELPETSQKPIPSHIFLTACGQQQCARECLSATGEPCGFFTNSLIKLLRSVGPNRITYASLTDLLPTLPDQSPQCEGSNKDRYLFEVEGPAHDLQTHALAVKGDGTMVVNAGSIHGVVAGTQFALKADPEDLDSTLVAVSVGPESSVVIAAPGRASAFDDGAQLVVADWKNDAAIMKVYVRASENPPLAIADVLGQGARTNFLVVDSLANADLSIQRTAGGELSLARLDAKLSRYNLPDVRLPVLTTNLPSVLDAIAHFNYFLGKRPAHGQHSVALLPHGDVRVEMYNLRGEYGARVPNMELGDLVGDENEVRFRLDTQEKYGFAICNYSERDLFPYLFYFDPASYSIDAWYLPESETMSAPLPARSSAEPTRITVGYGPSGGYAFQFVIPDGVTTDTGFLKLFVSTSYLDLTHIEQHAAVDLYGGEKDHDVDSESPRTRWPRMEEAEMWGALDVAVTMYTDDAPPRLQLS
ncbi:caspase domain-containing protein [Mycena galopus ATCC 62051]|nr:caspase domain-containing protein [Mycena galopus ATCC 62051]